MPERPPRTPRWWRALSLRVQVVMLLCLLPGVLFHELTHYVAARGCGRRRLDLDQIGFEVNPWDPSTPPWRRALVHLAPLLVGTAIALTAFVAVGLGVVIDGPALLFVYVGFNYAAYTWASLADLRGVEYLGVYLPTSE
ncbi:site-2 protease family protein [Halorubrum sp. LN27]|uniref:site-2 protease family protein n=1 Tax=Halorubrum sp. LN27 TaxID=2801032 RepID=UPI00190D9911|nr:site-2 protease family protein [Halorubrum sp. LN27]